jgi:hypothetical protein
MPPMSSQVSDSERLPIFDHTGSAPRDSPLRSVTPQLRIRVGRSILTEVNARR